MCSGWLVAVVVVTTTAEVGELAASCFLWDSPWLLEHIRL
jgi:hypothetical protein